MVSPAGSSECIVTAPRHLVGPHPHGAAADVTTLLARACGEHPDLESSESFVVTAVVNCSRCDDQMNVPRLSNPKPTYSRVAAKFPL